MRALSAWGATLYGFVAILALTPLAAHAALALPLAPRELALGLAVFCCMPTTLSSGVSLTQVCTSESGGFWFKILGFMVGDCIITL